MTQSLDVQQIRKQTLSADMSDGVMELIVGWVLTLAGAIKLYAHYGPGDGIGPVFISSVVIGVLVVTPWLKKRITYPRIGYVNVSVSGKGGWSRRQLVGTTLAVLLLAVTITVRFLSRGQGDGVTGIPATAPYMGLFVAGVISVVFSSKALLRHTPRLHIISGFVLAVFITLFFLEIYPGIGVVISGLGILGAGIALMIRFVNTHPILPEEDYERPVDHG